MRHAYLAALHTSGSAVPATGWTPRFMTLWRGEHLAAACPLYLKDAFLRRIRVRLGLGQRLRRSMAWPTTPRRWSPCRSRRCPAPACWRATTAARDALVQALIAWCRAEKLSSLHLLFGADEDLAACERAGLMLRDTVQFHWTNSPALAPPAANRASRPFGSFDEFLASLNQEKRKKIRQERRKVAEAGVTLPRVARARHQRRRTGISSTAATSAPTSSTAMRPT